MPKKPKKTDKRLRACFELEWREGVELLIANNINFRVGGIMRSADNEGWWAWTAWPFPPPKDRYRVYSSDVQARRAVERCFKSS